MATIVALSAGSRFMRSPLGVSNLVAYFVPLIALLAVQNKRANIAMLLVLLVKNAVFPVLAVLGVGMQSELF